MYQRISCLILLMYILIIPMTAEGQERELFPSGESIPTAKQIGYGQIGRGHDYRSIVMGTADVFGKGPYDLFLHPNRLYPFLTFSETGVPTYGKPVVLEGQAINGGVIAGPQNQILGVFAEGKRIRLCEFSRTSLTFETLAISEELAIPHGMTIGVTGQVNDDRSLDVYFTSGDGAAYRPTGQYSSNSRIPVPFHHSPLYIPFDGAGFWRGEIPRRTLHHARFETLDLKTVKTLERIGPEPGQILFDQLGMAIAKVANNSTTSLVTSEHLGIMRHFSLDPATGTASNQQFLNDARHVALRHVAITASLRAIPDPGTKLSNFLVGDTGRIWFYRTSGQFSPNGSPILSPPEPVLAQDAPLRLGELPVISPGDIDNDGLIDFMVGNDAGQLAFCKNIGQPGRPELANPVRVLVGNTLLDIKAGYRGSIQGPGEAMWGYTCPTVCDWNSDGHLDVILNSVLADYMVLLQIPSSNGVPAFREPRLLYCDGLQLHLAWRSQPGITDWGQKGPLCIIALDEKNLLRQFWRIDDQNVERGELLRLEDGSPITANADETAGQTGRAKLVPHDWDQDGRIDLLIGTSRGLSFPAGNGVYLPSHHYPQHKASVLLLRNSGSNQKPVFEPVRLMHFKDEQIGLGIHSCSPAPVDFGTGSIDLFVSEENGTVRYYPRGLLKAKSASELMLEEKAQ